MKATMKFNVHAALAIIFAVLCLAVSARAAGPYDDIDLDRAFRVDCEIKQERTFKGSGRHIVYGYRHTLSCELRNKSDAAFKKLLVTFEVHDKDGLYIESGKAVVKDIEPYSKIKFEKDLKKSFPFDKDDLVVDFKVERP